jgi:uncharacterized protein (DUF433 family)
MPEAPRTSVIRSVTVSRMADPISIRLPQATLDALKERAELERIAPRTLAQRMIEEGLRLAQHPMITFVDGPAGRRARMVPIGIDVWQLVEMVQSEGGDADEVAEAMNYPRWAVDAALAYHREYPAEIDQMIADNRRALEQGHAEWLAARSAEPA